MNLRHLQQHLPWTIAYSEEFEASASTNPLRRVAHDVLHVMKSLGRIAAECEAGDHARPRKLTGSALAKEAADLVICALHIARCEGFDLQDAVIANSEARNVSNIPPDPLVAAVLMFHSGGEWDAAMKKRWLELTGSDDATTKTLCDLARRSAT